MAQAAWLPSGSDRRPDFRMNVDVPSAPRPLPPPSELAARWDLADLLHNPARPRKMSSVEFQNAAQQPYPPPPDMDHALSSLHGPADPRHPQGQAFPHGDGAMHVGEHPNYDIFSAGGPGAFGASSLSSDRYRTNASSSSSLGQNYPMGADGVYSHGSFGDSMSSFHPSGSNYGGSHSLSSSYSSGKVSPLTPNDSVPGMHPSGFPSQMGMNHAMKEYSPPNLAELAIDRRMSGHVGSNGFDQADYNEFAMGVPPSMGMGYPNGVQRAPPFHDPRVSQHLGSQMMGPMGHGADLLPSVPPQAFRPGYGHFMPDPHADLSLMPGLENLAGPMHTHMGSANDLETFMRQVPRPTPPRLVPLAHLRLMHLARFWTST
jgi:recombining binding protein suppressor of hairless